MWVKEELPFCKVILVWIFLNPGRLQSFDKNGHVDHFKSTLFIVANHGITLNFVTLTTPQKIITEIINFFTVDFNSLWPRGFGNILGIWELRSRIRGFIVIGANQIANFEMKTTSLI